MLEEKSVLVDFFGDTPFMRVMDFLIENIGYDYTKTEIAKGSGIDWSTLSKMLDKMERYRLIVSVRKEKEKLYRLNEKNKNTSSTMFKPPKKTFMSYAPIPWPRRIKLFKSFVYHY